MSTLEWRREQPRARAPRHLDWFKVSMETLSWAGVACSTGLFIAGGEWFFLLHALIYGPIVVWGFH